MALNQLRLLSKTTPIDDHSLLQYHTNDAPLLTRAGRPLAHDHLPVNDGLFLSLALEETVKREPIGWRAKKNSRLLDLRKLNHYYPHDYWEPVFPENGGGVVLEPEEFYLLLSRESVRVPPSLAAEMIAYDPTSGELRTHYAGFFDPGFGHNANGKHGSRAALEVRAHDVPFMIQNGQRVCKLSFEQLVEPPDMLYGGTNSHYQFQDQTLSKHFRKV
jgi:dCTP deaminase